MKPVLRKTLSITGFLLLLAACAGSKPPEVNFRPHDVPPNAASGDAVDFTNEGMPKTTDSLEVSTETGASTLIRAVSGGVIIGKDGVPVLTVYTDGACDYCREFAAGRRADVLRTFVDPGTIALRIVFVPESGEGMFMAKVALCADRQDRFLEADRELSARPIAADRDLPAFAKKTGLTLKTLRSCIAEKKLAQEITEAAAMGRDAGASRVPFFMLSGMSWTGLMEDDELAETIRNALF